MTKIAIVISLLSRYVFNPVPHQVLDEEKDFYHVQPMHGDNPRVLRLPKRRILKIVDSVEDFDSLNKINLAYSEKYLENKAVLDELKRQINAALTSHQVTEAGHD